MSVPLSILLVISDWFRGGGVGFSCQQICQKESGSRDSFVMYWTLVPRSSIFFLPYEEDYKGTWELHHYKYILFDIDFAIPENGLLVFAVNSFQNDAFFYLKLLT